MAWVRCAVLGCESSKKDVKMFRFPADERRFKLWFNFCANPNIGKRPQVCALHFESKYFMAEDRTGLLIRSSCPYPTLLSPKEIEENAEKECAEYWIVIPDDTSPSIED